MGASLPRLGAVGTGACAAGVADGAGETSTRNAYPALLTRPSQIVDFFGFPLNLGVNHRVWFCHWPRSTARGRRAAGAATPMTSDARRLVRCCEDNPCLPSAGTTACWLFFTTRRTSSDITGTPAAIR